MEDGGQELRTKGGDRDGGGRVERVGLWVGKGISQR